MDWQTVREQYPHRWVVMEAPNAYIEAEQLVFNDLEVVKDFADAGSEALKYTSKLLHQYHKRHFVMYHTSHVAVYIKVIRGPRLRYAVYNNDRN